MNLARKKHAKWHRWFAWRPVWVEDYDYSLHLIWLEWVARKTFDHRGPMYAPPDRVGKF
jgi:hypothetical protein